MVLHSQQQRRGGASAYMGSRRRGGKRRWILFAVAAVFGGFVAWRIVGGGDGPQGAGGAEPLAIEPDRAEEEARPMAGGDIAALRIPDASPPRPEAPERAAQPRPQPDPSEPAEREDRDRAADRAPAEDDHDAAPAPRQVDDRRPQAEREEDEPDGSSSSIRSDPEVERLVESGRRMIEEGKLVQGRDLLNTALSSGLPAREARVLRREITELNEVLVFSPRIVADDPYTDAHIVESGDRLQRIAASYDVPWQFIARINNNLDPRRLQAGQRLKVIKGPFHAVVHKNQFRIDLYLGDLYVRSFDVGLGEHGSTPVGKFVVSGEAKLTNPAWTNPRTGESFLPDDPDNPLGGFWIGLRGADPGTEGLRGYGIHGTTEPQTIGTESSMGCVRLADGEIDLVFEMLIEDKSRVSIVDH